MDNLNDTERALFKRFYDLEGNHIPLRAGGILKKDINKYFRISKKISPILLEVLILLELCEFENEFDNFEYVNRINKAYNIAVPIVKRLTYLASDKFELSDLIISQVALAFASTVEKAEELCTKCLAALKLHMKNDKNYEKAQFFYHFSMIPRILKAEFFEVDHVNDVERSEMVKSLFERHLDKALRLSSSKGNGIPEVWEHLLNVRAGIMDKDSKEVSKHLTAIRESNDSKKIYDLTREEIALYSFHPDFDLTEKQFNISVGVRIRKLRENIGVTLLELADKLHYASEGNMSAIERGDVNLPGIKLARIADVFGITINELCFGTNNRRKAPLKKEDFQYSDM